MVLLCCIFYHFDFFHSAIWLSIGQLWTIAEEKASLIVFNKCILILILSFGEFWSFDHLERLSLSPAEGDVVWVENVLIHTLNHSANLPWNGNWYFWKLKLCNLFLFQFDFALFKSMRRAIVLCAETGMHFRWRDRES